MGTLVLDSSRMEPIPTNIDLEQSLKFDDKRDSNAAVAVKFADADSQNVAGHEDRRHFS